MTIKETIRFRRVWMILAMFWIILFHSELSFGAEVLKYIKTIGYGGVDIFLFASGIGCYFSYKKDANPYHFIQKRMYRIMPTFSLFLVVWIAYNHVNSIKDVIGNIFCVQSLAGGGRG